MADNYTANPGAGGDVFAADDIAGVKWPRIKVGFGADGAAADVSASAGLPVAQQGAWSVTASGSVSISGAVDTELPAAAALADNTGNPTAPAVGAFLMAFDGTNWDRVQTGAAATGSLKVDGSAVTQPVSGTVTANAGTGTFTVGGTVTANAGTGTFTVADNQSIADNAAFTDGTSRVFSAGFVFDETAGTALTENDAAAARIDSKRAQVLVLEDATTRGRRATVTAANALVVDGSAVTQPVSVAATLNVALAPPTSGGLVISRVISAASTNATSAKASAGQVFGWFISNVNASPRYLKLYNKASAPTVGTDTPVMTILIPGNTSGAGATVEFTNGIAFATGIAYALTTGVADADTGAVAANEIVVNLLYK